MIRRNRPAEESMPIQPHLVIRQWSIEDFVDKIQHEPGFSFARISDGGFFCIWGRKGVNCDGAAYSKEQADALIAMMKDDSITHGITSIAIHVARAAEWLLQNNLKIDWYDADVMNKASDEGKLLSFIRCLRDRKSIVVGAEHLGLLKGFPIVDRVYCHPTAAFEEVDELQEEISYRINKKNPDTILLSAGQGASPTLVSRLHNLHPHLTIIDTGSLFDPYVGMMSRSGHKKRGREEYKKLGWKNFNEDISKW